jgi:dolichol kinase
VFSADPASLIADSLSRIVWPRVVLFCLVTLAIWWCVGYLKRRHWLTTADARKTNHIWVLVAAACWFGWLPEEHARPSMLMAALLCFAVLLLACLLPKGPLLANIYFGYARESDEDRRAVNIWSSWLLGIYGLGLIDALCRDIVITRTAALILGIGDGLAEPVGTRLRRFSFSVPAIPGMPRSHRTLAGCVTVLLGTFVVVLISLFTHMPLAELLLLALLTALATMACEAISPHGTDNFTIPVAAGLVIYYWPGY